MSWGGAAWSVSVLLLIGLLGTTAAAPKKRTPGAFVLVVDRSGSMQGPKLASAKAAALAAVDALGPKDGIAIVMFDSEAAILPVSSSPFAVRSICCRPRSCR